MKLKIKVKPGVAVGYVAECPGLPGCRSFGPTEQQAEKKLVEAIKGYLASVNNSVPEQIERELELRHQP